MAKKLNLFQYRKEIEERLRGVHAKSKTSNLKTSKNYVKQYRGQGR